MLANDYNLWEWDGVVRVAGYEVFNGQTKTQDPIFSEVLGDAYTEAFAEALGITDWAGVDEWFTEDEWHALTGPIFAKVLGIPADTFK